MGRDARFYPIEGRQLPSVTTVLGVLDKPALLHWAVNMERRAFETALLNVLADRTKNRDQVLDAVIKATTGAKAFLGEKDKAAAIGTAAHAWIEWETRRRLGEKVGAEPIIPDPAMIAVESWKDWAAEVDFTPLCAERTVYCLDCGYAGTLDWIARVRGVTTLGDYKTSKAIYPESHLQSVAYRHAAKKCGMPTEQGMVIRLPKTLTDPAFEVGHIPNTATLDAFLSVFEAWKWKRIAEGKRVG